MTGAGVLVAVHGGGRVPAVPAGRVVGLAVRVLADPAVSATAPAPSVVSRLAAMPPVVGPWPASAMPTTMLSGREVPHITHHFAALRYLLHPPWEVISEQVIETC